MKIGIGVTTYNRPKHMTFWLNQYDKSREGELMPHKFMYIANDSKERRGIAYRKNECLKALSDCDYIFLFDDDCLVIKSGWIDFFIDAHKSSGQHHFMYLKETPTIKKIGQNQSINIYDNCGGCFMFLTKGVIEKVGGYDEGFGLYSFEHANLSIRIHKAGLTPLGKYTCPEGAGNYIYSMDYDFHRRDEFQKKVNHRPSMSPKETIECIKIGERHWNNSLEKIFIPI